MRTLIILACLVPIVAFAADLPPDPGGPIARKKELLFSDDFQKAQLDPRWHQVVETFTVESGALKGTQTRGGDKPHAAVFGLNLPTKDSVIEVKIRFEGNTMMDIEFDDRNFQGSHYGHLCCAQIRLDSVTILDQRDGSQSNAPYRAGEKTLRRIKTKSIGCSPPTALPFPPISRPASGTPSSSRPSGKPCA